MTCFRGALFCRILRHRKLIYRISCNRKGSIDALFKLCKRGIIQEIIPKASTPELVSGVPCAYAGFDATSDSLHVGNLLILVALLQWHQAGNQSIIVIGDATARIGDPSGRKTERDVIADDLIKKNSDSLEKSIYRLFDNFKSLMSKEKEKKGLLPIKVLRNSSWYDQTAAADFISAGRHIRLSEMISRTSVKNRIDSGEGINFCEFSYQLFQAFDWLHLFDKYKCQFQFGGNDQRGNVVTGRQLITGIRLKNVYGALLPLIESEAGDKYGKSAGNAIFLNEDRTSCFDFYQFYLRLPDAEVQKYLKLFTFFSLDEIEEMLQKHLKNPDVRQAQQKIAETVTLLVHGEKGLEKAKRASHAFYKSDLKSLVAMDVDELKQIIPSSFLTELTYEHGISLLDLTLKARCFRNESDALNIITRGGVYMNFERTTTPTLTITPGVHVLPNATTILRVGKKNYYLVVWK